MVEPGGENKSPPRDESDWTSLRETSSLARWRFSKPRVSRGTKFAIGAVALWVVIIVGFQLGSPSQGQPEGQVPAEPAPAVLPKATSPPVPNTAARDTITCQTFRTNFVDSDWGLLSSDEAATRAVGSLQASEVAIASSGASTSIASTGRAFSTPDEDVLARAIDNMLLACASVVTG